MSDDQAYDVDWESRIEQVFPDWRDPTLHQVEWAALMLRLRKGDHVSGVVIARAPFGAWLDLGVGFPAMIELPHIANLSPEAYHSGRWLPVGTRLSARVQRAFEGHIRLTQL